MCTPIFIYINIHGYIKIRICMNIYSVSFIVREVLIQIILKRHFSFMRLAKIQKLFFFLGCLMKVVGSSFPNQGLNPGPSSESTES